MPRWATRRFSTRRWAAATMTAAGCRKLRLRLDSPSARPLLLGSAETRQSRHASVQAGACHCMPREPTRSSSPATRRGGTARLGASTFPLSTLAHHRSPTPPHPTPHTHTSRRCTSSTAPRCATCATWPRWCWPAPTPTCASTSTTRCGGLAAGSLLVDTRKELTVAQCVHRPAGGSGDQPAPLALCSAAFAAPHAVRPPRPSPRRR